MKVNAGKDSRADGAPRIRNKKISKLALLASARLLSSHESIVATLPLSRR
jgi:hypothetical protein